MLGIFGLLFGTAAIVKDEFVEMDIDQRARESAYKSGRFYWVNTKGKYFTVEDNTPCYVAIRNGDRCVIRLKDDVLLKNLDAERKEAERKKKEEEDRKFWERLYERIDQRNEENRQKAIESGCPIYLYSLTKKEEEKYVKPYEPWDEWRLYKDVQTGELFAGMKMFKSYVDNYFVPVALGKTDINGKIELRAPSRTYDMKNNCYKRVFDIEKLDYRYERVNNDLNGLILDV